MPKAKLLSAADLREIIKWAEVYNQEFGLGKFGVVLLNELYADFRELQQAEAKRIASK